MQSMSASKFTIDDLLRKEPKIVGPIGQENNRGITEIIKISNCFESKLSFEIIFYKFLNLFSTT
jgi:hypothetical protein